MKQTFSLSKTAVVRMLCAAALLALPHNLFLKFILPTSYQHGLLLDYFIPKLFISDFFLIPLILWALFDLCIQFFSQNTLPKPSQGIIITLSLSTIWTAFRGGSEVLWWWIGLLASMIVGHWLSQSWARSVFQHWLLPSTLTLILLIQAVFANIQWYTQRSLTPYSFFGETNLSAPYSLVTITISNAQKVLPYGTTPHPNILAGTAVLTWFIIYLFYAKNRNTSYAYPLLTVASLTTLSILALTDSLSATLSLVMAGIGAACLITVRRFPEIILIAFWSVTAIALALIPSSITTNTSIARRLTLQQTALSAVNTPLVFLLGTGWGGTLKHIAANPTHSSDIARFAQPTHHAPSIWVIETGLLGSLAFWLFLRQATSKQLLTLAVITPTLILDHYWLTSHHAWWLLFVTLGLLSQKNNELTIEANS
jgi:hypothetical protein